MSEEELRQAIVDREHIKLLSIGYLVSACLNALFSLFGLMYAMFGVLIRTAVTHAPASTQQGPPPEFVAWIFGIFGFGIFLTMVTFGALQFMVYLRLKQHRARVFCMVVAGLSCIWVPYGTLLGIFTFVVLVRPSVVRLFQESTPSA